MKIIQTKPRNNGKRRVTLELNNFEEFKQRFYEVHQHFENQASGMCLIEIPRRLVTARDNHYEIIVDDKQLKEIAYDIVKDYVAKEFWVLRKYGFIGYIDSDDARAEIIKFTSELMNYKYQVYKIQQIN